MTFADDAGEYSIFVKNQHGEASASASLLEEGIGILFFLCPEIFIILECASLERHLLFRKRFECIKESFVGPVAHSVSASVFTAEYEAYMKQHDVTYKTEVTTVVVQEPSVVLGQYTTEQRTVTTPMSFVSETVLSFYKSIVL